MVSYTSFHEDPFLLTKLADERGCWIMRIPVIVENGVRLKLNIVDTPGYGDQINNEGCWEPIVRYVRTQPSFCLIHRGYRDGAHELDVACLVNDRSRTSTPPT